MYMYNKVTRLYIADRLVEIFTKAGIIDCCCLCIRQNTAPSQEVLSDRPALSKGNPETMNSYCP